MTLIEQFLNEEEGVRRQPYYDQKGFVTWGIGHLGDPRLPCPVPADVISLMFKHDLEEKMHLAQQIPGFNSLNQLQQWMLVSMVFQMGLNGVLGFHKFLDALVKGDLKQAAIEGLDSDWARKDSPTRAHRTMKILGSGVWVPHAN